MRETYQNIFNIVIVVFILGLSTLLFFQQKTLNQLKNPQTGKADTSQINRDQEYSKANVRAIAGRLVSLSGNTLTIEADMPDWKKMKEPRDSSKINLTYKKNYTVTVDDKTQFSGNKLDSIKIGDTISVVSKELVYDTEKLTAVFIMSPNSTMPGS